MIALSRTLALLSILSVVPLARAGESSVPESSAFEPPNAELTIEPQFLADAPAKDLGNDYTDGWRYRSNLSLWASSIEGTLGKGRFESDVDVAFTDLFDKLTLGLGLDFEVGKGPLSLIVFGIYDHFEADAATLRGFDADTKADFAIIDVAGAYRLISIPGTDNPESHFSIDALIGLRWTFLKIDFDINDGPFRGDSANREQNWFDPYGGARVRYDFDRHWNISALGTIGGFGIDNDNLAWSAYGQLEYRFDERWSFILGYRAISCDYENNGFIFDVTLHGPVIGLGMRM